MTWTPIVGKAFSADSFRGYAASLNLNAAAWQPSFIVLHNTGAPNLSQRPVGFTAQHMQNLQGFYRDQQKWSAGPHLFVDDKQIWAFTPLTHPGIHSPSWNAVSWGIEMLGDYDVDDFRAGRGAQVRANAVAAMAALLSLRGLPVNDQTIRLHHEDPKTTHHGCPGATVAKPEVLAAVAAAVA